MVVTVCCEQPLTWSADLDWWHVQHAPGCTSRWSLWPPGPRAVAAQHCVRCGRLIGCGRWCDSCLAKVTAWHAAKAEAEAVMVQRPEPVPEQLPEPVTCAATAKAGTRQARPCRLPPEPGSDRCAHHQLPEPVMVAEPCDQVTPSAGKAAGQLQACAGCGQPVMVTPGSRRRYCSTSCRDRAHDRARRAKLRAASSGCLVCGGPRPRRALYCSAACRQQAAAAEDAAAVCGNCSAPVAAWRRFCCARCRNTALARGYRARRRQRSMTVQDAPPDGPVPQSATLAAAAG